MTTIESSEQEQKLTIGKTELLPGQNALIKLPAGQLPSGNKVEIQAHVYRGLRPGPTVLLLAGVHGDEINGVEIVRKCVHDKYFEELMAGTVIAIPLLNVFGFNNFSRDVPDGKDVNRAFPGTSSGSLAARVAHVLHKNILPHIDFGIDFHTGGRGTYNFPQLRYTPGDDKALEIAKAFGSPLIVASKAPSKSLRKTAKSTYDLPILTYEGGENQRYDGLSIQTGINGIKRLLAGKLMLGGTAIPEAPQTIRVTESRWTRAERAGLFQWFKSSGNRVRKGEPIGVISDPQGQLPNQRILSKKDGYIIGHANAAVVSQGDALFHIGKEE
ncbi:MAG: succinylglutamate desuccinylase/aspartoacylase family protein [Bacteroidota bacterium]